LEIGEKTLHRPRLSNGYAEALFAGLKD